MDAAAINWTLLVVDHLNPSFLNFDRAKIFDNFYFVEDFFFVDE